jgi:hypothetical protein
MKRTLVVLFVVAAIASMLYAQQSSKVLHVREPIHNGFLKASQYLEA